jgi:hypothetical protein
MKKIYLLLLIFIVFSCKNTPKDKITDDPGLSQLDLTKEKTQAAESPGFSDEPPLNMSSDGSFFDESALVQDGIPDGSDIADTSEIKTDDLADAKNNEQMTTAEAVEEKKDTTEEKKPSANEVKPPASIAAVQPSPAPAAAPVQPPPAAVKEEPPAAKTQGEEAPAAEKLADEKQEEQSESEEPPPPPARYQPWITPPPAVSAVKDDAPVPNKQVLIPPKEENVFSRIVRATVGQLVEIPFRGNNWSYLEDMVSRRGIAYMSRRVDSEGMTFTFRAEETGIFALRFYRRDYIRDYIVYDYVQVIVEEQPNKGSAGAVNSSIDRGKVTAEPRWPSALEEAEMQRGGARTSSGNNDGSSASSNVSSANKDSTAAVAQRTTPQVSSANRDSAPAQGTTAPPQTASSNRETQTQGTGAAPQTAAPQVVAPSATPSVTPMVTPPMTPEDTAPSVEKKEKLPPEEIIKKAQDAFNGGNAAEAIALLDQYTEFYPGGNDELYWLYGQFYEANTPSRNILLSLDYYRRLVNEYPQSRHYSDARRRISYLERFYINIQ